MITLYGRFKGKTGFMWHCLPISDLSTSKIPFRKWIATLLHQQSAVQGRREGWLSIKRDGRTRAQIRDYDEGYFSHYMGLFQAS